MNFDYQWFAHLQNEEGQMQLFLNVNCKYEGENLPEDEDGSIDVFCEKKLQALGLIWCAGDAEKKAKQLFKCCHSLHSVDRFNRELKQMVLLVLRLSTDVVIRNEHMMMD